MKQKITINLILALFISISIIVYSFYAMTLRWGIYLILLIFFSLLWTQNPNLKEKYTPFIIGGIVIGICFIIYSFYMHTLVWGSINAIFAIIIIALFISIVIPRSSAAVGTNRVSTSTASTYS